MPTVTTMQDTQAEEFIWRMAKHIYLIRQQAAIEEMSSRGRRPDLATMTFDQFYEAHPADAEAIANQCREVMQALQELHFDVLPFGSWLPRKTIVVSELSSSSAPIQGFNQGTSPRRR